MRNILKFLTASILFISCSKNSGSISIPDDFNSESVISRQNHLQKILTKEMVARVVNVSADKVEEHIENRLSNKEQYTLLYSWPTGSKKKIAGGKHQIDEYHSISIGFVKKMSTAEFEKYYGTNHGLQQQVDDMVKKEHFNKETGTVEAKYIAEYAGMRKTEKLGNVATMAYWETPMNALHVLAKDAAFTITANFGDDEALAKKQSVKLVSTILNP